MRLAKAAFQTPLAIPKALNQCTSNWSSARHYCASIPWPRVATRRSDADSCKMCGANSGNPRPGLAHHILRDPRRLQMRVKPFGARHKPFKDQVTSRCADWLQFRHFDHQSRMKRQHRRLVVLADGRANRYRRRIRQQIQVTPSQPLQFVVTNPRQKCHRVNRTLRTGHRQQTLDF